MEDEIRGVLERHPQIAFGLVFGSVGRGEARADSDLDVAVGLVDGEHLTALGVGGLVSEIEHATGREADVVVLEGRLLGLDYRAFRDGKVVFMRDRAAFLRRKVRAILDYLDFKPIEDRCVAGVLKAAARG
jgi:predicted nucleotidyltransferase